VLEWPALVAQGIVALVEGDKCTDTRFGPDLRIRGSPLEGGPDCRSVTKESILMDRLDKKLSTYSTQLRPLLFFRIELEALPYLENELR
jgi:hypothetical protein